MADKGCPFCGSNDLRHVVDDGRDWKECKGCGATGPIGSKYDGANGEPYVDWNTRAALEAGGMVMVPVTPSADMKAKGREALPYNSEFANSDDDAESVWDAMLSARPQGGKR